MFVLYLLLRQPSCVSMRISQSKTQVKQIRGTQKQQPNTYERKYWWNFGAIQSNFKSESKEKCFHFKGVRFFFGVNFRVLRCCPPCLGATFKYAHITHRQPSVHPCSAHITEKTSLIAAKLWALVARVENIEISIKNFFIFFFRESFILVVFFRTFQWIHCC